MNEHTVIRTMQLQPGTRPWRLHADANLVVLCSSLDEAGREAALTDLLAYWRRTLLRVVPPPEADWDCALPATEPFALPAMI